MNNFTSVYKSCISLKRLIADLTEVAATVEYMYAPPATVRRHLLQDQIPTHDLFIDSCNKTIGFENFKTALISGYFIN